MQKIRFEIIVLDVYRNVHLTKGKESNKQYIKNQHIKELLGTEIIRFSYACVASEQITSFSNQGPM